jgi:choline dehydrogenase-like flavoprotein
MTADAIVEGSRIDGDLSLTADVVVIGSGAGGAVVAAELAEAGQDVLILEEGPFVPPERYGRMRPTENLRHLWRDGGMTFAIGLGDTPVINVMMGQCVGGSSVLTGGVCFRIPDRVMHTWGKAHGLTELNPRALEPVFEEVERRIHVEEVPASMRSRSTQHFLNGLTALGLPWHPMRRNTRGCNGCGRCNFGCPHGAKLSVDVTYLPRALAAGARLYSECRVDTVDSKGGRACGVSGRLLTPGTKKPRGRLSVRARRVVLAAGAYASPLLLLQSGIGRSSGQVGRNMTVHPGFRVMARFADRVEGWKGALQSAYSDALEHERITMTSLFIPPGALAGTLPGIGPSHRRMAESIPHLAIFGGMIHDDGGGRVHQLFGRSFMTYRMAPEDRAAVPVLMRRMAEAFFAAGAKEVFLPVLGQGGVDADGLRRLDLERVPGSALESSSQHPLGTCRMGVSPRTSVVDPWGECWELPELYVADGGIVPTSLGVNPQLSIMSMALRIAWRLREKRLPH